MVTQWKRVSFLFRAILLGPQESSSDGICVSNLAIQGHPHPGIPTWVIKHTDSGGLETKLEFAGGLAGSKSREKQGTSGWNRGPIDHICACSCRPRDEKGL